MAITEIDEKLLVRAYQAGDARAFDTIVRTQYQALFAHAMRRLSSPESAEDAVQDTLLRAYRALPNLDGDLALRAWLHRILTNVCHDEGNRRRRQQGLVDKVGAQREELAPDPIEEAVLHDTVKVMTSALDDLPDRYREALVLRYVDGLSFREVAEATGISEENARARVHRGRQALHKLLAKLAVAVAFVVPGLRRTANGSTPAPEQAAGDGSLLVTQLTSHALQAAPTVSRLAELSSALPGGKGALAAAAVTAVAAMSVPVAYTVREVRQSDRPAAVAQADPDNADASTGPIKVGQGSTATTVDLPSVPETTLPPSQAEPFAPTGLGASTESGQQPTTTTAPPPPPVDNRPAVTGALRGDSFAATKVGPQFDLDGPVRLASPAGSVTGTLTGRLSVFDDGTAGADELVVTIGGAVHQLRFRAYGVVREDNAGTTTYRMSGAYALSGADAFGLASNGTATLVFRFVADGGSSLTLDLQGRVDS